MGRTLKRSGALLLAMLILLSVPMAAFAAEAEELYTNGVQEILVPESATPGESESEEPGELPETEQPDDVESEDVNEAVPSLPEVPPVPISAPIIPMPISVPVAVAMPAAPTRPTVVETGRTDVTVTTVAALRAAVETPTVTTPLRVIVTGNIDLPSAGGTVTVNHTNVIIEGAGAIRTTTTPAAGFPALTVSAGSTLVLRTSVERVTGLGTRNGSGVVVQDGGTLIMDSAAARVATGVGAAGRAGGVTVTGSNATFYMMAGRIDGNTAPIGGGVLVSDGATFNMFGGNIDNNRTSGTANHTGGAGVGVISGATFNLAPNATNEHVITGQIMERREVAFFHDGPSTTAAIAGTYAIIERNELPSNDTNRDTRGGGGVFVSGIGSTFNMHAGNVRNNWIRSNSTSNLHNCIAEDQGVDLGGGASVGRPAGGGGGVRVGQGATFNMANGMISNNRITGGGNASWDAGGGGVMAADRYTEFNMTGGMITSNSRVGWLPNYSDQGFWGYAAQNDTVHGGAGAGRGGGTGGGGLQVSRGAAANLAGNGQILDNAARRGGGIATEGRALSNHTLYGALLFGWNANSQVNGRNPWCPEDITRVNISGSFRVADNRALEGWGNASGGGIFVGPNTVVTLNSGYVEDNKVTNTVVSYTANGGGVRVTSRGHFVMNGGYIKNNQSLVIGYSLSGLTTVTRVPARAVGGGVAVRSDRGGGTAPAGMSREAIEEYYARFTMNGGTITGNWAGRGGGIGLNVNSTVVINAGYIIGNVATGYVATGTGIRTGGSGGGAIGVFEAYLVGINRALGRLTVRPPAVIRDNIVTGPTAITSWHTGSATSGLQGFSHYSSRITINHSDPSLPAGYPYSSLDQLMGAPNHPQHHLIINDDFFRDHGDYFFLHENPPPATGPSSNPWRISPGQHFAHAGEENPNITPGHFHVFNNFDIMTVRNPVFYPVLGMQPYFEGERFDPISEDVYPGIWRLAQTGTNTFREAHAPRYDASFRYWRSADYTNPPEISTATLIGRPVTDIVARHFGARTLGVQTTTGVAPNNRVQLNVIQGENRFIEQHWQDTVRTASEMTLDIAETVLPGGGTTNLTAMIRSQFYGVEDYVAHQVIVPATDARGEIVLVPVFNDLGVQTGYRHIYVQEVELRNEVVQDRVETLPIHTGTFYVASEIEGEADIASTAVHYIRGSRQADDCELDIDFHNHDEPIPSNHTILPGQTPAAADLPVPVIFPAQTINWTFARVMGQGTPGAGTPVPAGQIFVTYDADGNIILNVSTEAAPTIEGQYIRVRGTVAGTGVGNIPAVYHDVYITITPTVRLYNHPDNEDLNFSGQSATRQGVTVATAFPADFDVVGGDVVVLHEGTNDEDLEFLGWFRGTTPPAVGTDITGNPNVFRGVGDAPYSFTMPTGFHRVYHALWGYDGVVGAFRLNIQNVPSTGLTHSGQIGTRVGGDALTIPGTNAVLAETGISMTAGDVAGDQYFLGWYRGTTAPAAGTRIEDLDGVVTTNTHTFNMPEANITYFALWGSGGMVGGFNLTVSNVPTGLTHSDNQRGTAGGAVLPNVPGSPNPVAPDVAVRLYAGEVAEPYSFLGWYRLAPGATRPGVGTNVDNLGTAFTTQDPRTFNMPSANVEYIALWGHGGIVGALDLTITNVPAGLTHSGQLAERVSGPALPISPLVAPGTNPVMVGTALRLTAGTVAEDHSFLGWYRGTTPPTVGTNVNNLGSAFTRDNPRNFTMPNNNVTYFALWGSGDIVGGFDLIIENVPAGLTHSNQSGTAGGNALTVPGTNSVLAGVAVSLSAGQVAQGHSFLGWYRGTTAPAIGTDVDTLGPNFREENPRGFTMPNANVRYFALWGSGTIVGAFDLTVTNVPAGLTHSGQSGTVNNAPLANALPGINSVLPGAGIVLTAGTVTQDHDFLGWYRGTTPPANGTNVNTLGNAFTRNNPHDFAMPSANVHYFALWGHGDIVGAFNLTITNVPAGLTHSNQSGTAGGNALTVPGTNSVVAGAAVSLTAGQVAQDHNFLGWYRGTTAPANGTDVRDLGTAFTTQNPRTFAMPSANVQYFALWGDGYIVGAFNLAVTNVPAGLTHSNQSAVAGGTTLGAFPTTASVQVGTPVSLIAGGVDENHYFLGWYRYTGVRLPVSGMNLDELVQANLVRATGDRPNPHTVPHTFNMAAGNVQYFALWGARDIIGASAARIIFDAYGIGAFMVNGEPAATVEVPVVFGAPLAPSLAVVNTYLISNEAEFAFWGWFFREEPTAYPHYVGLTSRTLLRDGVERHRPSVENSGGRNGFNVNRTFTEAEFNALAGADGSIRLYAIWSLWGDVDDNDAVNVYDLEALAGFLRFAYPRPVINMAPADVHRDGAVNVYDLEALAGFLRFAYPRPVLGARP